ncbi:HAD family hydrolase [Butyricicoccus faecihominis]|uniref:HAD family hydrolase n=1 Tax=Butyricicoccaceae TaxID=3085642 RepID=UPI0024784F78|nr:MULTISPECIES: HAD family hydrolase [Butyricicoccaceae]MCQ5128111.1 HAD family hydrolase [Butyricicoccus faecihominis]WNX86415.1 HAD family hydrolase [Agathobaculum sp. NTUH-O15-33]
MKRIFAFDIDGTLIDTVQVDQYAIQTVLREQGREYTLEELRFSFGMPGREALRILQVPDIEGTIARWEQLAYAELDKISPYEGVIETLCALRARGAKLGIVTARTRAQYEAGFQPLGLEKYFDTVVCADEVAHPKPAPDELHECLRRLGGTAEEAVYIGDSRYDMACARSAGVTAGLALWGCEEADALDADHKLSHPSEILKL